MGAGGPARQAGVAGGDGVGGVLGCFALSRQRSTGPFSLLV